MRLLVSAVLVLAGLSGLAAGAATAQPSTPPPAPPGSTSDELADMVMDAIEHDPAAPTTTTPVPPPR
jgi:hypothetical protein